MATSVYSLPASLILLIHLHILEYPCANNPEYDPNVFDPLVRGVRERTKSMEDICYFLVGHIEGSKDRVKKILPTYPCLRPMDTTAFRASLAKYLETLRHQNIRSTETNIGTAVAWWWKDVVVRKSLIEECSGERFERLVLSLSTQALLKGTSGFSEITPDITSTLHAQPRIYSDLLSASLSTRHTWSRSASLLLQRQDDLNLLRHLASGDGKAISQYSSLSTERLLALSDSKLRDLLRDHWSGRGGNQALDFLTELAGLMPTPFLSFPSSISDSSIIEGPKAATAPSPPLPIAAAHHPSNLRKVRNPVFSPKSKSGITDRYVDHSSTKVAHQPGHVHRLVALLGHLDVETRMTQALEHALSRARNLSEELGHKLNMTKSRKGEAKILKLDLWQGKFSQQITGVDFQTQPTADSLTSLALYTPLLTESLESNINYIRESLLPGFPPVPVLSNPQYQYPPAVIMPPNCVLSSRLPQPSAKAPSHGVMSQASSVVYEPNIDRSYSPPQTPQSATTHLFTSTPPAAVKPRSAYARHVLTSQTKDQRKNHRRQSIRFSLATTRRPSLFATDSEDDNVDELGDKIDHIVRGMQDDSTSFNDAASTPRPNILKTGTGSKTRASTVSKPKHSFPMPIDEPSVRLPSLVSSSSPFSDSSQDEIPHKLTDDSGTKYYPWQDQGHKVQGSGDEYTDDEELYNDEGPSMTLGDILLRADTTHFDLLDDNQVQPGDESIGWE